MVAGWISIKFEEVEACLLQSEYVPSCMNWEGALATRQFDPKVT